MALKKNNHERRILITGGAGFIGSHMVRRMVMKYPDYLVVNVDALTYAGNLQNLADVAGADNYKFENIDIRDAGAVASLFDIYCPDAVIHFAAESHVDRSISSPMDFVFTNVVGTVNLLNASRNAWKSDNSTLQDGKNLFYHISTDEVYGSLGPTGLFKEESPYQPNSPYSASKASSDHFVRAYGETYDLPYILSNCSNNYGPYQYPEKLIPLFIKNIIAEKPLPVYGDGLYTRDWLYVSDHVDAIDLLFHKGKRGETYNIGGHNEWKNIDLVKLVCRIMDKKLNRTPGTNERLITYVEDRAGHDRRYAIDAGKIKRDLNWVPSHTFEQGIEETIDWYLANQEWMDMVANKMKASKQLPV